ncbi:MAG: hypothetical protein CSA55_00620 [Ilumatobacter coccineus]|uniref:BFN domain-containing protein n=1 Tax=Ilumatobacter coccineus TaxID=467094 RepID=A0A2G6KHM8_9ACTN|nr:MAG: hypothetical protein CSA55_00620 [Ilumatobacter coccineus]
MRPIELLSIRIDVPANAPLLLMRETTGDQRLLPIYIGSAEAAAIHTAIEGISVPRPLTHDLFVTVVGELGASLDRVVISRIVDHTFFADLHLSLLSGKMITVSARPSDAVALAVRVGAPLFASKAVLDEAGQLPAPSPEDEAAEIIDEFKNFIDQISPEDFV